MKRAAGASRPGADTLTGLREELDRALYTLAAFAIAVLPERVKQRPPLDAWVTTSAHVLSGVAEFLLAAALFITGMLTYVAEFTSTKGMTYLVSQPTLGYGDFFGVGALAYLSYLIRPTSLLLVYCFAEGIVRVLEASFWDRLVGLGVVSIVWRGVEALSKRARRAERALLIGPARPDEIVAPGQSRSGLLEIFSVEDKSWSDYQVVELGGEFYQLATRRFMRHGEHHAYRYQLHLLEAREVIRGTIIRLDAGEHKP